MQDSARKADAYRKIQLGGLVIKAGLGDLSKVVLLGALLEVAKVVNAPDAQARLRALGAAAFEAPNDAQDAANRTGGPA